MLHRHLDGDELDASRLLLHELGFLEADDPRFIATVEAIGARFPARDHLFRYVNEDDFGFPETACSSVRSGTSRRSPRSVAGMRRACSNTRSPAATAECC